MWMETGAWIGHGDRCEEEASGGPGRKVQWPSGAVDSGIWDLAKLRFGMGSRRGCTTPAMTPRLRGELGIRNFQNFGSKSKGGNRTVPRGGLTTDLYSAASDLPWLDPGEVPEEHLPQQPHFQTPVLARQIHFSQLSFPTIGGRNKPYPASHYAKPIFPRHL